ncbi:tRNA dimethylallyltransferase [Cognatiyoonia sediminum]|uniref:tRNA dimethylallyltransferase n=1 Tax=Cognatiyoonia sediminum TaxID=1508389 RepID=A0A1M5M091_9RHOB|nr:tRNA (adenosine(37)-N6)-dimethylallyltransferase MiaA [Cognatiyoonia sediminum]SHG70752.1 tRNA dimethylallyltransferase [Cognatiyoonia sediminum]
MTLRIDPNKTVLIAGPTASGKSSLALMIAEAQGGLIVNADALQVYDGWRILTARPSLEDEQRAAHQFYGHLPYDVSYSVGDWLRDVKGLLGERLIIVGGTGLYFSALTEGLANIPETPTHIRATADGMVIETLLSEIDEATKDHVDIANRARVQRAWEVLQTTGRSLVDWQSETPAPLLPLQSCTPILLNAPKEWLTPRIEQRFDMMLEQGVLEEAREMSLNWDTSHPSSKAIGAQELIDHVNGRISLDEAREAVIIGTRQYAKRQRTWFRKRMTDWAQIDLSSTDLSTGIVV